MTPEQFAQYEQKIRKAMAANPDVARYGGTNDAGAILSAYTTGDFSNLTSLTGKPFTREQQQAAVTASEKALNPAYKAAETFDRSVVEDKLRGEVADFGEFRKQEADVFKDTKEVMDQDAADSGVLFSGSRFQKLNDLRNTFEDREALRRSQGASRIGATARDFQYDYGNDAARRLSDLYRLPGSTGFNANVAGGQVTPNRTVSSVYNPSQFNFQGVRPVAQKAAVQTRAASLLGNRANKLSSLGYKTQF